MHTRLSTICSILLVVAAAVPSVFGQARPDDRRALLERLRREIAEHGYTFTVGDNPALDLPLEALCGTRPHDPNWSLEGADAIDAKRALPTRFDWREAGGLPPVRNQGSCGSCWAFAAVGVLECQVLLVDGEVVNLSEQQLVDCNRGGPFGNSGCNGGFTSNAMFYISSQGVTFEAWYPYKQMDFPYGECIGDAVSKSYKPARRGSVANEVAAIKQAIYDHGPVACSVAVDDLFQAYTGGIYNGPGAIYTNHAVILVGWDDNNGDGYWIMRNSWGTSWGLDGYMLIRWGAAQIGSDCIWAETDPAVAPALVQSAVAVDSAGNGVLDPGETATVRLTVHNHGTAATGISVGLASDDPLVTVTQPADTLPDLAKGAEADAEFTVTASPDAPKAHRLEFALNFTSGGFAANGRFWHRLRRPQALVIDLDGNANSGPAVLAALLANGVDAVRFTEYDLSELDGIPTLFVCLGVSPHDYILSTLDGVYLRRALARGQNMYLEGGDVWSVSPANQILQPWFNATCVSSGDAPLTAVTGAAGTPYAGLDLPYTGDNENIDQIIPATDGWQILQNAPSAFGCGVATNGHDYWGTWYPFKAIAASFEFGGLAEGSGANSRLELMRRIAEYLTPPKPGDLNLNGAFDAEDIALLAHCVAGNLLLPEDADPDYDGDGRAGATDLLRLILFVTD